MSARRRFLAWGMGTVWAVVGGAVRGVHTEASGRALTVPPSGSSRYRVEKGGIALGEAMLAWAQRGGEFDVQLATQTSGMAALFAPFSETRISRGVVTAEGWWVPQEVRRERPERPPEVLVREGEEVVVTRKGKTYRYPAAANAQDLLSLLFSLPTQVARGRVSGQVALLGVKGEKRVVYQTRASEPVEVGRGTVTAMPIAAATERGDWQVILWWRAGAAAPLVQLEVTGEEGAFRYRVVA